MDIFVTGAGGFVGGALARRLLSDGHVVCVMLHRESGRDAWERRGARVAIGDVGDPNFMAEHAHGCQVMYHCASEPSHRADPEALQWINVAGAENAVRAAQHAGVRRFVYLSCADCTLINADRLNWKESRPLLKRPIDAHARSKKLAEELCLASSRASTETTAVRPAWIWGPGDTTTLPLLCQQAERGGVRLYGSGRNLLATVYIDNLVDALLGAATARDVSGKTYYIADGELLEAREFLGMLSRAMGWPPPRRGVFALSYARAWLNEVTRRDGPWRTDVIRRARGCTFDIGAALNDLGYSPRVSAEQGLEALGRWVAEVGGAREIARMGRAPATSRSVSAQIEAADAL